VVILLNKAKQGKEWKEKSPAYIYARDLLLTFFAS
jgi:hypothetical protein